MKGKTASGFKFDIDVEKLKEWDFIDLMSQAESDDDSVKVKASVNMVKFILDADYDKFIAHIKAKNNGSASVEVVLNEVTAILNACKATKK